jgi:predicted ATP-grasp superfamily ATP-dependent carboligase
MLQTAFCDVLHPSNEALDICLSKAAFAEWCLSNTLEAPKYCRANDDSGLRTLRYPVLVRPTETLHHESIAKVPKATEAASLHELENILARFHIAGVAPIISESLLRHRLIQYSVPFARRDGEIRSFVARKLRPPPEWCTVGTCVELSPNAEVEALARRAVEALDYYGIGEVEILHSLDERQNYLVEINARPWMQYSLASASGHDFLRFMLGRDKIRKNPPAKRGYVWLDFTADFYVCFSGSVGIVRHGATNLSSYLLSLCRTNAHARFSWTDPKPWIVNILQWLRRIAASYNRKRTTTP